MTNFGKATILPYGLRESSFFISKERTSHGEGSKREEQLKNMIMIKASPEKYLTFSKFWREFFEKYHFVKIRKRNGPKTVAHIS